MNYIIKFNSGSMFRYYGDNGILETKQSSDISEEINDAKKMSFEDAKMVQNLLYDGFGIECRIINYNDLLNF